MSLSAPFWQQYTPAVAVGNGLYLVVWSEGINNREPDIHAVRVRASDGVVLDTSPLRIATGTYVEHKPVAAFDGTNFLVVWEDHRNGAPLLYGTRVRASDGAVLDVPHLISKSPLEWAPQFNASVAFDGTNFVVTWEGGYSFWAGFFTNGIQGIRVRPSDGKPIEFSSFLIAAVDNGGHYNLAARVACGGGRCLVVWPGFVSNTSGSGFDLHGARLEASTGRRLDPSPLRLTNTEGVNERGPSVASDGKDFLVTWHTGWRNDWNEDSVSPLFGARVRGSDGARLDPNAFTVAASQFRRTANVTFDGSDYRVVFEARREGARQLLMTRVSPDGVVAGDSERVLSTLHPSTNKDQESGIAAMGRGRFLVAYNQYDPGLVRNRVRLRQVEDLPQGLACTRDAQCQSGFCVDGVCCQSACGGGGGKDCQACSVAAGGVADGVCGAVRADAAVVCRPLAVACDVAEVCDGTSLSCPADEPSASEPDLSGDKCEDTPCEVRAYVEGLAPEQVEPGLARSLVAKAEGACQSWRQGNARATQGKLRTLLNEVEAQRGKHLSESVADTLVAALGGML